MVPRRGDIERTNLRALICRADERRIRRSEQVTFGDACIEVVECVGSLEPRTRESKIEVHRVRLRKLKIQTIEQVLFISLVVHHDEFRWVQEPAAVQSGCGDEISPVLTAVPEVEAEIRGAERAIGSCD